MDLNELFARLNFRANVNLPEVVRVFPGYEMRGEEEKV